MTGEDLPKLTELDQEEWWEVCQRVRPDISREEYDAMWQNFQERKEAGALVLH